MGVIFRQMLLRHRLGILGFGLGLALLGWPLLSAYTVVQREQERILALARNFEMFITGLGGDVNRLASPESYLSMRYFTLLPLILGAWVVLSGSGLLASDEENGTLDLLLAHPVSRTAVFLGRWLAFATSLAAILFLTYLGLILTAGRYAFPADRGQLLLPFVSLLAVLLFFGNLALLLSLSLPSRRLSVSVTGLLLAASFFLTTLARVDPGLEPFARISPLQYYQSGEAIRGLNAGWLVGLFGFGGLWLGLAWWRFERRDIRVAGEGVWGWPFRRRRRVA